MASSADPDQLASSEDLDLHCLQRQDISGFSRTRVNIGTDMPEQTVYTKIKLFVFAQNFLPSYLLTILILKIEQVQFTTYCYV